MEFHSLDGATFFPNFTEINYDNVKNEVALIFAEFGADRVKTSKVTSCETKWPCFLAHPVQYATAIDAISHGSRFSRKPGTFTDRQT